MNGRRRSVRRRIPRCITTSLRTRRTSAPRSRAVRQRATRRSRTTRRRAGLLPSTDTGPTPGAAVSPGRSTSGRGVPIRPPGRSATGSRNSRFDTVTANWPFEGRA
jgi:hypothetical protein